MDATRDAATRRGASEKQKKGWTISVAIISEDPDDEELSYIVEGAAEASLECPRTKPISSGQDEEQDTRGQPGWWFLLATRHFRPLPVEPVKQHFPSHGKRRLSLKLAYGKAVVMTVQGLFDFDSRRPPPSAKIHVDKNHAHPRYSSGSSSQQSTPNTPAGTTDYLFLRTQDQFLTAVRLFVPYSVLARGHLRLGAWLTAKRIQKMHKEAGLAYPPSDGELVERLAKRPRREAAPGKENARIGTNGSTEMELEAKPKRKGRPTPKRPEVIEIDLSDEDGDGEEEGEEDDDEEDEYHEEAEQKRSGNRTTTAAANRRKKKNGIVTYSRTSKRGGGSSRTAGTTTTTTTTTATTPSMDMWEDEPLVTPANGNANGNGGYERDGRMCIAALVDDNEEVSLGSEFELTLDPLDLGPAGGPVSGRPMIMEPGEESVVVLGKPRRRQMTDDEEREEGDEEEEAEDAEEATTRSLLAPAQAKDVFVWNSQSQGLSQGASQLPVEEIDRNEFLLQPKDVIGSGSFARVYRASYKGMDIAVKVFKPNELPTRIDNEVRILGKLRGHANVVKVVGYCVVNEQKQIAMEYCAYGNLHECIHNVKRNAGGRLGRAARRKTEKGRELEAERMRSSRRGRSAAAVSTAAKRKRGEEEPTASPADPYKELKERRASLLVGIARGMQHLHNNSVCHRDLSSMNVLVDANWVPKIADFGLSTVDISEMKGMGVGTGRWRAPEVFKNKPKNCQEKFKGFYTNSSDVYSFGVIVWEMFHLGQVPWEGELDPDVKRKVMQGERPKIDRDVPRVWRELIEQCWAQEPDRRPSFANVVHYLEANHLASSS